MKEPVFQGSCTAMITPFDANGIDIKRLEKLLDFQRENGTAAIVLAGTTGENPTLEAAEYEQLIAHSVRYVDGRMKMIAGVGGNNTMRCLERAKFAKAAGADAILMTPPYYNKTSPAGVIRHFLTVADSVDLPLILYNIPSRTSIGITLENYRALAAHPHINGVKEASGDFSLCSALSTECGETLTMWSGNDDHTIPMMALGAKGVVSVLSNLLPRLMADLCSACLSGDFAKARELYRPYAAFCRGLFIETNPIPLKTAMRILGLDSGQLRLPLTEISPENEVRLRESMRKAGLLA